IAWLGSLILGFIFPFAVDTIDFHSTYLFVGSLILGDYAFYWSHRLFHSQKLFPIHFIHHTSPRMDLLATSRNTLWQPLLYPHVWLISFALLVFTNPAPIILAVEIMGVFDYWNHSGL